MELGKIGRNQPCPCGSGQKFKHCHLGREQELISRRFSREAGDLAQGIIKLPPADHPRAAQMARGLELVSAGGKRYELKLVDLEAYRRLDAAGGRQAGKGPGGVLLNPNKTRTLDPSGIYLALSPGVDDSTVVHQLAHVKDMARGRSLPLGMAAELADQTSLPLELLEHSQEFGETMLALAQEHQVALDAEDEIIAILARRRLLLPAEMLLAGENQALIKAAENALRYLREHAGEVDARIKSRPGYTGSTKPKK